MIKKSKLNTHSWNYRLTILFHKVVFFNYQFNFRNSALRQRSVKVCRKWLYYMCLLLYPKENIKTCIRGNASNFPIISATIPAINDRWKFKESWRVFSHFKKKLQSNDLKKSMVRRYPAHEMKKSAKIKKIREKKTRLLFLGHKIWAKSCCKIHL